MKKLALVSILVLVALLSIQSTVLAEQPVVRAMLFFSPTCGHCHKVINENMPVIFDSFGGIETVDIYYITAQTEAEKAFEETNGPLMFMHSNDQLEVVYVNVGWEEGYNIFAAAAEMYELSGGVPQLIVGDQTLVGSLDIPTLFPAIVAEGLAGSGIDWPPIAGLQELLDRKTVFRLADEASTAAAPTQNAATSETTSVEPTAEPVVATEEPVVFTPRTVAEMSMLERVKLDPLGNSISILVLIGMIICLILTLFQITNSSITQPASWKNQVILVISIIGLAVAAYLTFVESTGTEAVCGPVGDCNTVNQSEYAFLFGLIPVGGMGMLGYIGILTALFLNHFTKAILSDLASMALFGMATFGTLFSIYLTFLEPFIIGATCAWCLSSAIIITTIMALSSSSARAAWNRIK